MERERFVGCRKLKRSQRHFLQKSTREILQTTSFSARPNIAGDYSYDVNFESKVDAPGEKRSNPVSFWQGVTGAVVRDWSLQQKQKTRRLGRQLRWGH